MKRISIRDDDRILEVQYDGALTFAERTSALEEVHALLRRSGFERVLLDFTGAWAARNSHEGSADTFLATLEALGFAGRPWRISTHPPSTASPSCNARRPRECAWVASIAGAPRWVG